MPKLVLKDFVTAFNTSHPLKSQLKQLGMPQVILAKYVGVHHQTFFKMLNGYQPMPEAIEHKLEELLQNVQTDDLRQ